MADCTAGGADAQINTGQTSAHTSSRHTQSSLCRQPGSDRNLAYSELGFHTADSSVDFILIGQPSHRFHHGTCGGSPRRSSVSRAVQAVRLLQVVAPISTTFTASFTAGPFRPWTTSQIVGHLLRFVAHHRQAPAASATSRRLICGIRNREKPDLGVNDVLSSNRQPCLELHTSRRETWRGR